MKTAHIQKKTSLAPAVLLAVMLTVTASALLPVAAAAQELGDVVHLEGGTFLMGSNGGKADAAPAHEVTLSPFTMDAHEVTAADFARFLDDIGTIALDGNPLVDLGVANVEVKSGRFSPNKGMAEYPAVGVTWYGAQAYAEWAGKKLPTEAQWEYAARGGIPDAVYPWGDEFDALRSNLAGSFTSITPVMSYIPNGFGLFDMAGNVMEWTRDRYGEEYYARSPKSDPKGPIRGDVRTARGGAWDSARPTTVYDRTPLLPETALSNLGFRCVEKE
ncbi:MAG: formylglycine-generating enzyme family protein [Deltaproteobacteria bacterium]|nr:formylglycine-generating enzyme family protein [Candidatus Zymogenaceae bacterium]